MDVSDKRLEKLMRLWQDLGRGGRRIATVLETVQEVPDDEIIYKENEGKIYLIASLYWLRGLGIEYLHPQYHAEIPDRVLGIPIERDEELVRRLLDQDDNNQR